MLKIRRRDFLKALAVGLIGGNLATEALAWNDSVLPSPPPYNLDKSIKDYLHKMKHFNKPRKEDIRVSMEEYATFTSVVKRLRRLEAFVGHGNFQYLNFDNCLLFARNYEQIGKFTEKELNFLEETFYRDAAMYGFLGSKPLMNITDNIKKNEVIKVPYSGTFLRKDPSLDIFSKIRKKVGDELVLTSGVRGIMKQFLLFLNKAYTHGGNLSLASRSLAPPGYSFHGIGDFDVGKRGFGIKNFTEGFTSTEVYRKLVEFGYLTLRYPDKNLLGVRYEPWHIKISGA